jgi:hypothetical protein
MLLVITHNLIAQDTPFERKREQLIQDVLSGGGPRNWAQRVWVWLDKMQSGEIDGDTYYVEDYEGVSKPVAEVVHDIIQTWGNPWLGEGYAPIGAWRWAESTPSCALIWMIYKYADVISADDLHFLEVLYHNFIHDGGFATGSINSQLHEMVGRYLWGQSHSHGQVQYSDNPPINDNIYEFSYGGRTYTPGEVYDAFELPRDWLNERMEVLVLYGNDELESPNYTWAQVHSFITLYEFAVDPVMKRKAKMVVDFILLESVLDFVGNQWGGVLGRSYEGVYKLGMSRFYWDCFWDAIPPDFEPSYNILFSSYRLPDIIYDIGDLSDEPDNYYHINKEYNRNLVYARDSGKWNWVTKFFSLGGRIDTGWQLCISSDDPNYVYPNRPGVPFRVWINTKNTGEDVTHATSYEDYLTTGEYGYQYKTSMFARGPYFHQALSSCEWDDYDEIGNVRLFKEGRTMMAAIVDEGSWAGGLEVAIEGVDYASFDAFKAAAASNYVGTYGFRNSRGDVVSFALGEVGTYQVPIVKHQGESDWERIWDFPFPRLETTDHQGRYIVRWDNSTLSMTLSKHGRQAVYNFQNWTITTGDAPSDTTPPGQVTGVSVSRRQ